MVALKENLLFWGIKEKEAYMRGLVHAALLAVMASMAAGCAVYEQRVYEPAPVPRPYYQPVPQYSERYYFYDGPRFVWVVPSPRFGYVYPDGRPVPRHWHGHVRRYWR